MEVLSQERFKYSITAKNISGVCDFNDDFLYIEANFVENVPVVNG